MSEVNKVDSAEPLGSDVIIEESELPVNVETRVWYIYNPDSGAYTGNLVSPLAAPQPPYSSAWEPKPPAGAYARFYAGGWIYDPIIDIADTQAHAANALRQLVSAYYDKVRALRDLHNVDADLWIYERRLTEARALMNDANADAPFITAEASALGADLPKYAATVVDDAHVFYGAYGECHGGFMKRRALIIKALAAAIEVQRDDK